MSDIQIDFNHLIKYVSENSKLNKEEVKELIELVKNLSIIEIKFSNLRKSFKKNKLTKLQEQRIKNILEDFEKTKNKLKPIKEKIINLIGEQNLKHILEYIQNTIIKKT